MVLDKLGSGLKTAFRKIGRLGVVNEEAVNSIVLDVQRTLLQSDVDAGLVFQLSEGIKKRVLKEKPPAGMTLKEHFIKILYDEIVRFLGAEKGETEVRPQKIMLIGLFGSGKTSTAGKLGKWFKTRGLSVGLSACDTHRPAAQEQLSQLAKELGAKVYKNSNPEDTAKEALKSKEDVLIFDTAGRDALDKKLAKELKTLGKTIKPDEVLLVLPADIGQTARKQAEEFNKLVGITGIIVTKLDGTAKGGGALSAASVSGAKVKFITLGEKLENLEQYDPERFVSRLIGYGDLQGLLEKAKEAIDEKDAERIKKGDFTLKDFVGQVKSMKSMGSLKQIAEMIPGMSVMKIPKDVLDVQEEKMKTWEHIINSMTPEERKEPEMIKQNRASRIAKGSGAKPEDVKKLIKNYKQARKMMKMASGKSAKRGPLAKLAKQMGMKI